jgi:hypothetical protein
MSERAHAPPPGRAMMSTYVVGGSGKNSKWLGENPSLAPSFRKDWMLVALQWTREVTLTELIVDPGGIADACRV